MLTFVKRGVGDKIQQQQKKIKRKKTYVGVCVFFDDFIDRMEWKKKYIVIFTVAKHEKRKNHLIWSMTHETQPR